MALVEIHGGFGASWRVRPHGPTPTQAPPTVIVTSADDGASVSLQQGRTIGLPGQYAGWLCQYDRRYLRAIAPETYLAVATGQTQIVCQSPDHTAHFHVLIVIQPANPVPGLPGHGSQAMRWGGPAMVFDPLTNSVLSRDAGPGAANAGNGLQVQSGLIVAATDVGGDPTSTTTEPIVTSSSSCSCGNSGLCGSC